MNILDELYNIFSENNNSKSIKSSWKECRDELNIIPEESIETITSLIHMYAGACQKEGFNNGFYYGVRLMAECMSNKGGASNE